MDRERFVPVLASSLLRELTPPSAEQQADGTYALFVPVPITTHFSLIHANDDFGAFVRAAIETDASKDSGELSACTEEPTFEEMMQQWSEGESLTCLSLLESAELTMVLYSHRRESFRDSNCHRGFRCGCAAGPTGQTMVDLFQWIEEFGC